MNTLQIPVIRGANLQGSNIATYVGVISATTLKDSYDVPYRDVIKGTGYQRIPAPARVRKLANEIKAKKVDLPTAVLLCVRSPIPQNFIRNANVNGFSNLSVMDLSALNSSSDKRIYVVDGQHRILAIEKALEDMEDNPNLKIPFVCMVGADESTEMWQFYNINKNAKPVATDLVYSLMREKAENDPEWEEDLTAKGRKWEVIADKIVVDLSQRSVWGGLIRLANTEKLSSIVPSASFIKSLQPLLTHSPVFRALDSERRLQLLEAYWKGIEKYYLSSGAKLEDRGKYGLFKGIGVTVMNKLLPDCIEGVRNNKDSLFNADAYNKLISPVFNEMEGVNGKEKAVSGIDFWLSGSSGAVGSFTSGAGQRILIDRLKSKLPETTYE